MKEGEKLTNISQHSDSLTIFFHGQGNQLIEGHLDHLEPSFLFWLAVSRQPFMAAHLVTHFFASGDEGKMLGLLFIMLFFLLEFIEKFVVFLSEGLYFFVEDIMADPLAVFLFSQHSLIFFIHKSLNFRFLNFRYRTFIRFFLEF